MREEKKPYNPFHLASGHAARSLPDKLTIAVFKCYCNHTDFMGGSVSISVETVAAETGYSVKSVNNANKVLKALGRITRKSRGRPGSEGGKQSSITTVFCTDAELERAGANEENFYSRGGKGFAVKTQKDLDREIAESERGPRSAMAQPRADVDPQSNEDKVFVVKAQNDLDDAERNASRITHKCDTNVQVKAQSTASESANWVESMRNPRRVKAQPIAQEPFRSEPLKSEPLNQPLQLLLQVKGLDSKTEPNPTPKTQDIQRPAEKKDMARVPRPPRCAGTLPDPDEGGKYGCKSMSVPGYRFCQPCLDQKIAFGSTHPDIDPEVFRDPKYPKELVAGVA